jgi:putative endonuclease
MRRYCVQIMATKSRVLYIGITNDIRRRVWEHKSNVNPAASRSRLCGAGAFAHVPPDGILRSFAPLGRPGRLPLRDSPVFTALYTARVSSTLATRSREKYLKGWLRERKVPLIRAANPTWEDLSEGWFVGNDVTCFKPDANASEKQVLGSGQDDKS